MASEIIVEFPSPLTDKEKKMIYGYKGEIVRCKDCKWYQLTAEGDMACVKDADVEDRTYFGFIQFTPPWWFCAAGERREVKDVRSI